MPALQPCSSWPEVWDLGPQAQAGAVTGAQGQAQGHRGRGKARGPWAFDCSLGLAGAQAKTEVCGNLPWARGGLNPELKFLENQ